MELDLSKIVSDAKKEAVRAPNRRRSNYDQLFPVIDELRNKNFSWSEIGKWFGERGVSVKMNAIHGFYRRRKLAMSANGTK